MTLKDEIEELREEINSCERYGAAEEAAQKVFHKVDIEIRYLWEAVERLGDALASVQQAIEELREGIED